MVFNIPHNLPNELKQNPNNLPDVSICHLYFHFFQKKGTISMSYAG